MPSNSKSSIINLSDSVVPSIKRVDFTILPPSLPSPLHSHYPYPTPPPFLKQCCTPLPCFPACKWAAEGQGSHTPQWLHKVAHFTLLFRDSSPPYKGPRVPAFRACPPKMAAAAFPGEGEVRAGACGRLRRNIHAPSLWGRAIRGHQLPDLSLAIKSVVNATEPPRLPAVGGGGGGHGCPTGQSDKTLAKTEVDLCNAWGLGRLYHSLAQVLNTVLFTLGIESCRLADRPLYCMEVKMETETKVRKSVALLV